MSGGRPPDIELPMRIVLRRPPAGVRFALQHGAAGANGKAALVGALDADGHGDLVFELTVRARIGDDGSIRFLGPFTQGPPNARFVYITVGTRAGQLDSCWDRRAKVPLAGISAAMARATQAAPAAVLEATVEGTLPDGSPTCATRPFVKAWHLT